MDEDRLSGAATNMGGKIKDAVGGLVGDSRMQAEGKGDQLSGRVQNTYGSAKDAVSDGASTMGEQIEGFVQDQPVVALLTAAAIGFVFARLINR